MLDKKRFIVLTIVLFLVETYIALYVHDTFVRPFVGDILVILLLYTFMRIFIKESSFTLIFSILGFAWFVEFLQFVKIVEILGLEKNAIARTVIGTSFDWKDIGAYSIGAATLSLYHLKKRVGETYDKNKN